MDVKPIIIHRHHDIRAVTLEEMLYGPFGGPKLRELEKWFPKSKPPHTHQRIQKAVGFLSQIRSAEGTNADVLALGAQSIHQRRAMTVGGRVSGDNENMSHKNLS